MTWTSVCKARGFHVRLGYGTGTPVDSAVVLSNVCRDCGEPIGNESTGTVPR